MGMQRGHGCMLNPFSSAARAFTDFIPSVAQLPEPAPKLPQPAGARAAPGHRGAAPMCTAEARVWQFVEVVQSVRNAQVTGMERAAPAPRRGMQARHE